VATLVTPVCDANRKHNSAAKYYPSSRLLLTISNGSNYTPQHHYRRNGSRMQQHLAFVMLHLA